MGLLFAAVLILGLAGEARAAGLTPEQVDAVKSGVAIAATALLCGGIVARRLGRGESLRRLRDGSLALLGIAGAACGWNLFQFNFPDFAHPSDTFHYYLGAKYFPELGYTGLYACTAVAEAESGRRKRVAGRFLRDLETNALVSARTVLAEPERCTSRFSSERWQAFRGDMAWFRKQVDRRRWALFQTDHGYNATPAWGILGSLLANTGPATDRQIFALRLIDPLLVLAMWGCVAWAFGWRTLCVALVFWGTTYAAPFGWTGGAYLRQGWLASSLIGICLLRRRRHFAAGFLLAVAAFLRVFPIVLLAGLGAKILFEVATPPRGRIARKHVRLLLGVLLAGALVVPASAYTAGGLGAWQAFANNSRTHLDTPLRNSMGLKTLLSYAPSQHAELDRGARLADPFAPWKAARQATFARRAPLFYALVAAFAVLLALAARRQKDWVAAVLGIGLVTVAFELTGYYHALFAGYALLFARREAIGAALCSLAALGWLFAGIWLWYDEIFPWLSLAEIAFVLFATLTIKAGTVLPLPFSLTGAADRRGS